MGAGFHNELANREPLPVKAQARPGVQLAPRRMDFQRIFWGDPSPMRAKQIMLMAAFGDPCQLFELYDRMIESDPHIRCESDKRRMAVTGLDYDVQSASLFKTGLSEAEVKRADEFAAQVRSILRRIRGLLAGLRHLIDAVGRGVAVCEVEWGKSPDGLVPVALHPVPGYRLRFDYQDPWRLRVLMDEHDMVGTPIDELPPGKFIVHAPNAIGGSPLRGGLYRPALLWWIFKTYGVQFFMKALELFGQPFRTATYAANSPQQVQDAMLQMLEEMGVSAAGIFPEGTSFQVHDTGFTSGGSKWPQERLVAIADAQISKLFIGATLMTEVSEAGGNRALGEVQDNVREDIRDDDIKAESETITEQLIRAIARAIGSDDAEEFMPRFSRSVPEPQDDKADAELLDRAVNRWGIKVPVRYAAERFRLPVVKGEDLDAPMPGAAVSGDDFSQGLSQDLALANSQRQLLANADGKRKLEAIIAKRRTPAGRMSSWLMAAVLASTAHTANVVAAVQTFIEKRRDSEQALAELPQVFETLPIEEMQTLQEHFLLASKMAGMLDARAKIGRRNVRLANAERAALLVNAEIDFERIPFVQAIESLRDRVGLNPDEFANLEKEARSRAWRVAGVHDMQLLATIHTALVQSIAAGETSRDFRLRLPAMAAAAGWSGENPHHADLVHFQNSMMAHAAGRFAEYQEFEAAGWRFVSNGDACPLCQPYVNKVFKLSDRKAFPPVHFWCDCEDEVIFEGEADVFDESAKVSNLAHAEELERKSGFKWDPAEYTNLTPLKLGGFPRELQPVFKKFGEGRGWKVTE